MIGNQGESISLLSRTSRGVERINKSITNSFTKFGASPSSIIGELVYLVYIDMESKVMVMLVRPGYSSSRRLIIDRFSVYLFP